MVIDMEAARAAGYAAGADRSRTCAECPFSFPVAKSERMLWFSGFAAARRRLRALVVR